MDSEPKRISYFVSFCVEQYKNSKHLTGSQAFEELNRYGVLDYLAENYEILHTQTTNGFWRTLTSLSTLGSREQ